jgi:hypothetical protein
MQQNFAELKYFVKGNIRLDQHIFSGKRVAMRGGVLSQAMFMLTKY